MSFARGVPRALRRHPNIRLGGRGLVVPVKLMLALGNKVVQHFVDVRYLAALARSGSGVWGRGAIVREFHGLDHEALGPTLTAGQAATNSRLLVDLRPVPPRETRRASALIPRKRSPCPGPAQGPPRARARPAQGPLIFYGTARRILDSQGFGVLISLNLQNQGFGGPCCKT